MSDKPAFDPSKPFEAAKPAFDPKQPFQEVHEAVASQPEDPGMLASAGRGVAQGATLGFGDELSGAKAAFLKQAGVDPNGGVLSTAMHAMTMPADATLAVGNFLKDPRSFQEKLAELKNNYTGARDAERTANDAAQKTHPYAFGAGQMAGSVVPALATGGSTAGLAGFGAGNAIGSSNSSDPGQLAKQAALGAAGTVAGGKAVEALTAPLAGKAGNAVGDFMQKSVTPVLDDGANLALNAAANRSVSTPVDRMMDFAAYGSAVAHPSPYTFAIAGARGLQRGIGGERAAYALSDLSQAIKSNPQQFGQYAQTLSNAASRGNASLAVTNFLLGQQFPDYRKMLGNEDR